METPTVGVTKPVRKVKPFFTVKAENGREYGVRFQHGTFDWPGEATRFTSVAFAYVREGDGDWEVEDLASITWRKPLPRRIRRRAVLGKLTHNMFGHDKGKRAAFELAHRVAVQRSRLATLIHLAKTDVEHYEALRRASLSITIRIRGLVPAGEAVNALNLVASKAIGDGESIGKIHVGDQVHLEADYVAQAQPVE